MSKVYLLKKQKTSFTAQDGKAIRGSYCIFVGEVDTENTKGFSVILQDKERKDENGNVIQYKSNIFFVPDSKFTFDQLRVMTPYNLDYDPLWKKWSISAFGGK